MNAIQYTYNIQNLNITMVYIATKSKQTIQRILERFKIRDVTYFIIRRINKF